MVCEPVGILWKYMFLQYYLVLSCTLASTVKPVLKTTCIQRTAFSTDHLGASHACPFDYDLHKETFY